MASLEHDLESINFPGGANHAQHGAQPCSLRSLRGSAAQRRLRHPPIDLHLLPTVLLKGRKRNPMSKTTLAVSILFLSMAAYAKPNVSQAYAQCETDAYAQIGLQVDRRASLQYLETKYELIRVCLVRQGYRYTNKRDRPSYYMQVSEQTYKTYGAWKTPAYQIEPRTQEAITNEINKAMVLFDLSSQNWTE